MVKNYYKVTLTKLGWIGLCWSSRGLSRCTLPAQTYSEAFYSLGINRDETEVSSDDSFLKSLTLGLDDYFRRKNTFLNFEIDLIGTYFQKMVWQTVLSIPYGSTRSYSWVAKRIGSPGSYRAVGQALKANPIAIFVPCHRIIAADGSLGGYAGTSGLGMKRDLLKLEGYIH